LSAHVRQDRLGHPHDAVDVDVEDVLRLPDGELLGGAVGADAGVVDQDVDAPEPVDHLLDHRGDRFVAGHVEVEVGHPGGRGDSRGVAGGSDHLETRAGERDRCRFADA
jgi:hypothetical protein